MFLIFYCAILLPCGIQCLNNLTFEPTGQPSGRPSHPTFYPTSCPSRSPDSRPSGQPTKAPLSHPSRSPESHPSGQPTKTPLSHPTSRPSSSPSNSPSQPSGQPTGVPSHPSGRPTDRPTASPSSNPSSSPTKVAERFSCIYPPSYLNESCSVCSVVSTTSLYDMFTRSFSCMCSNGVRNISCSEYYDVSSGEVTLTLPYDGPSIGLEFVSYVEYSCAIPLTLSLYSNGYMCCDDAVNSVYREPVVSDTPSFWTEPVSLSCPNSNFDRLPYFQPMLHIPVGRNVIVSSIFAYYIQPIPVPALNNSLPVVAYIVIGIVIFYFLTSLAIKSMLLDNKERAEKLSSQVKFACQCYICPLVAAYTIVLAVCAVCAVCASASGDSHGGSNYSRSRQSSPRYGYIETTTYESRPVERVSNPADNVWTNPNSVVWNNVS